jgi:CelD/BcsL family acetyltransferase involved in cellulose biosynthesis
VGPTAVYTSPGQLAGVAEEWRDLAGQVAGMSYFATPDWVLGWWETVGDGLAGEVATWRGPGNRLEAVAALARTRQRLHPRLPVGVPVWTNLGSGAGGADHCGWPVVDGRVAEVRSWVAERTSGAAVMLSNLDPEAGRPFVPPGAKPVAASRCPRLAIPDEEEAIGSSRNLRKQLRAYTRKLLDQGVTFRWVPPEQMTGELLEMVFRLHEQRWSVTDEVSSFDRSREALHRRLIVRAGPGHGPAMLLAERDGRAVGVNYGFLWGGVFAAFQSGWEPEWAAAHLGTVLDGETIRAARAAGARTYDFLRGAEGYKYRFGAVDRVDETWLLAHGGSGRLLDLRYRLKARLEPARVASKEPV